MISHKVDDLKTYLFVGISVAAVTYLLFKLFSLKTQHAEIKEKEISDAKTEEEHTSPDIPAKKKKKTYLGKNNHEFFKALD